MTSNKLSKLLKTLSDENRRLILWFLSKRDICVCEFEQLLNVKQSTISSHLKILSDQELVRSYKESRWVIYQSEDISCRETKELMKLTFTAISTDEKYIKQRKLLNTVCKYDLCQ